MHQYLASHLFLLLFVQKQVSILALPLETRGWVSVYSVYVYLSFLELGVFRSDKVLTGGFLPIVSPPLAPSYPQVIVAPYCSDGNLIIWDMEIL